MSDTNGEAPKRPRGRPKGSKNKVTPTKGKKAIALRAQKELRREGSKPCKTGSHLLNDQVTEIICSAILRGAHLDVASAAAGISRNTLVNWLRRGNDAIASNSTDPNDTPYIDFVNRINKTNAEAEKRLIHLIYDKGESDAKYLTWIASRRFHERWGGEPKRHEHIHQGVVQHQHTATPLNMRELLAEVPLEVKKQLLDKIRKQRIQQEEEERLRVATDITHLVSGVAPTSSVRPRSREIIEGVHLLPSKEDCDGQDED